MAVGSASSLAGGAVRQHVTQASHSHLAPWKDSNEILGTCAEIINSTARYIYDVLKSTGLSHPP